LAANKGNAVAQCNLGHAYMNGNRVKKDVEKAKHWYTKAAEQGHGDAVKRLKEMESRTIS
jgi:TPR repeat protein